MISPKLLLAGLALALPATAIAQDDITVAGDRDVTVRQRVVNVADLDLNRNSDVFFAEQRLLRTAKTLCANDPNSIMPRTGGGEDRLDCIDRAYQGALYDLDSMVSDIRGEPMTTADTRFDRYTPYRSYSSGG